MRSALYVTLCLVLPNEAESLKCVLESLDMLFHYAAEAWTHLCVMHTALVKRGNHKGCSALIAAKKLPDNAEPMLLSWLDAGRALASRDDGPAHKAQLLAISWWVGVVVIGVELNRKIGIVNETETEATGLHWGKAILA